MDEGFEKGDGVSKAVAGGGEFGVKLSLREIERILPIKMRNFKLWKMPN